MLLHEDVRRKYFTFIGLTPEPRNFRFAACFEVAVPREPYYNPVNLWNRRSEVKKKEFIQAISFARSSGLLAHQRSCAPRWHFFFRVARLGSSRFGCAAAHAKSLSRIH